VKQPSKRNDVQSLPAKMRSSKLRAWIDMFGGRTAKAGGSVITDRLKHSAQELMSMGTFDQSWYHRLALDSSCSIRW